MPELDENKTLQVRKTSNPDQVIVRTQIKGAPAGEYRQETISIDEANRRGIDTSFKTGGTQTYYDPGELISASGVKWKDYGDYLADITKAGYKGTGTLNSEQQGILASYQLRAKSETAKPAAKATPAATDTINTAPPEMTEAEWQKHLQSDFLRVMPAGESTKAFEEKAERTYYEVTVELADGTRILKRDYDRLPADLKKIADTKGYAELNAVITRQNMQAEHEAVMRAAGDKPKISRVKAKTEADNSLIGLTLMTPAEAKAKLKKSESTIDKLLPGGAGTIAAAGIVTATPIPLDDVAFWAFIAGVAVVAGAIKGAEIKKELVKIPAEIREAYANFVNAMDRQPTTTDIVNINENTMKTVITGIHELDKNMPAPQKVETRLPVDGKPSLPVFERIPGLIPSKVDRTTVSIPANVKEGLYLPTPQTKPEDLLNRRGSVIAAEINAGIASNTLEKTLPGIGGTNTDWDKILQNIQNEADVRKAVDKALANYGRDVIFGKRKGNALKGKSWANKEGDKYRSAVEDFVRQQIIYREAWQSYVASINPAPVNGGKVNEATKAAVAAMALEQTVNTPKLRQLIRTISSTVTKTGTISETKVQQIVQQAVKASPVSKTLTKAQVNNLVDTITEAITETATGTRTATAVKPATAAKTATAVTPATATATTTTTAATAATTAKPTRLLNKTMRPKKIKEYLAKQTGLVAWRQGQVGGKDVWNIIMYPYKKQRDLVQVIGIKPPGAALVKGKRSAYKTAAILFGKGPGRTLTVDIGAQDAAISKDGKISFTPDPKRLTTGDFTISKSKVFPLDNNIRGRKL